LDKYRAVAAAKGTNPKSTTNMLLDSRQGLKQVLKERKRRRKIVNEETKQRDQKKSPIYAWHVTLD
jgi:hypothetical protein